MEELEAVLETGGAAAAELAASGLAGRQRTCPNCNADMSGRFCSTCGQPADVHRRSVHRLIGDLVKDIVSFDSRILRTCRALLFQPGELASAFREGRTQRYVPPVRLYLFVSLIFFVVLSLSSVALVQFVLVANQIKIVKVDGRFYTVDRDGEREEASARMSDGKPHYNFNTRMVFFAREGSLHADLPAEARSALHEKLESVGAEKIGAAGSEKAKRAGAIKRLVYKTLVNLENDPAALNGALTAWVPRALFILLPLFALLLAAFYWRQRRELYFVDHLVFSLGFHSFAFALLLGAAALAQVMEGEMVAWLTLGAAAIYLLLAMRRFYRQNWFWTVAKFAVVGFVYAFFFAIPVFALMTAAAVWWS